jgi:hypothetical protein
MLILFKILQTPLFRPVPTETPIIQQEQQQRSLKDRNLANVPIIQAAPVVDIRDFRAEEEQRLQEYAQQDGKLHIPVEKAMQLVVRDMPVQKEGQPPTGVTPTPEMNLHPRTDVPSTGSRSPVQGGAPVPGAETPAPGSGSPAPAVPSHLGGKSGD